MEIKKSKENSPANKRKKTVRFSQEKDFSTNRKSRETISTYGETLSTEEYHKTHKEKSSLADKIRKLVEESKKKYKNKNNIEEGNNAIKELKFNENDSDDEEEKEENVDDMEEVFPIQRRGNRYGTQFTPIPFLRKKTNGEINAKDVEKAIVARRQEYNDYLKSLNKPKPKKPKPKPKPKPKVYDINKVQDIQKIYKGFRTRSVNQIINRLKINLCVTELNCLILNEVFKHACIRIGFYTLKLYYHDPFTHIENEIDFSDRLSMKLSDKYYNFNNFKKGLL